MCKQRLLKILKTLFVGTDSSKNLVFDLKYMELDDSYF